MKPALLIILYVATVTLPLCVSWLLAGEPRSWHQELASGFGILAYSILLAEFVLSGRFKSIANTVGMDVTMRFHQLMARTALVLALLHPLLYLGTPAGGQRPWDPTRQLTVTTDFASLASGIGAYLLLAALVVLAMGRSQLDFRYETWRLMHGVGALLIAALLWHHTVSAGRYGSQPPLSWLWLAMTVAAAGLLVYVYVLVPLRSMSHRWRVSSVRQLTPRQWELTLKPEGHQGLDYKAGQFVWLNVGHSTFTLNENPFSICSAPAGGPEISFMIKELGDFTRTIGQTRPGTIAHVDGPYGSLAVEGRREPGIALIAGGVGIAPLLGILRQLRLAGDPRKVRIVYGNRREDQIAWQEELDAEDAIFVLSEPPEQWHGETGWIDGGVLDRHFGPEELKDWLFVLCGPAAMLSAVEDHLIARGVAGHRILTERFEYD
ncbi:ferredoxin reductase family protein [Ruegeria marina]|uniref:Predicted ferric reductase n=1 Tax=Ruegeria marina TaxID=639004 RepID=A0A1G6KPX5_9RHOB|nr:ferric reductase-like transmembrane domain-containing protein [Ruegeria marina]SDC32851.1 Predicted ferric reductase [Ruegeria marina]